MSEGAFFARWRELGCPQSGTRVTTDQGPGVIVSVQSVANGLLKIRLDRRWSAGGDFYYMAAIEKVELE